jgi:hypothetical protein
MKRGRESKEKNEIHSFASLQPTYMSELRRNKKFIKKERSYNTISYSEMHTCRKYDPIILWLLHFFHHGASASSTPLPS